MVHSAARRPLAAAGWWAVLLTALVARGAAAADASDVTIERMRLSTDRTGILSVESGGVLPHLGVAGSLWVGYANDELVLHRLPDGPRVGSLVNDRWGGAASASVGLLDRAQLSLEVPVTFYQDRSGGGLVASARSLDAFGVGSLRLVPKVRLLEERRHGVDLAVQVGVTAPLGADSYIGSEWTAQPEVAISRQVGEARLGLNLGAALRDGARLVDERLGSELVGQAGAAYGLKKATGLPLEVGAVLAATASASHPFEREDETSVEARGYGAYDVVPPVRVLAGAGFGLMSGWGTPDWRVFAGVQVTIPRKAKPAPVAAPPPPPPPAPKPPPPPPDRDGDGIPDAQDRCPAEPVDTFLKKGGAAEEREDGAPVPGSSLRLGCVDLPAVLAHGAHTRTLVAHGRAAVLRIPRAALEKTLQREPALAETLALVAGSGGCARSGRGRVHPGRHPQVDAGDPRGQTGSRGKVDMATAKKWDLVIKNARVVRPQGHAVHQADIAIKGGRIDLAGARLDASGTTGGGAIRIGGETADSVTVDQSSVLAASACCSSSSSRRRPRSSSCSPRSSSRTRPISRAHRSPGLAMP